MRGIYIHVPFCERKCPYCAFYSRPFDKDTADGYLRSLTGCISAADPVSADTLYFGGGTPALIGAESIGGIIALCRQRFGLKGAEITLECNPNSIGLSELTALRRNGVNRLSVGVQSLDDGELRFLGRLHGPAQAVSALEAAREAGFENISADLMIGIRGQSRESLCRTVDRLSRLGVKHISVYMIKVEQGTAFDCDAVRERLCGEDRLAELYLSAAEICEKAGFAQYEISNFARPGYESRHNCKYWECEEYLGFGPAAHSFYKGVRFCCPDDLSAFIENGQQRVVTDPAPDPAEEYVMLGLRLSRGIDLDRLEALPGGERIARRILSLSQKLEEAGLCIREGSAVQLTPQGMLVSNSVIAAFLS